MITCGHKDGYFGCNYELNWFKKVMIDFLGTMTSPVGHIYSVRHEFPPTK